MRDGECVRVVLVLPAGGRAFQQADDPIDTRQLANWPDGADRDLPPARHHPDRVLERCHTAGA